MKLSAEKLQKLAQELKLPHCPLCQKRQWILGDTVFYLNEYHEDGFVVGGPSFPVIPIVCAECGNTIFINTIITKLTDQPKETDNG